MVESLREKIADSGVNAFVLGFPKCGTTAFAEWLNCSSAIDLSKPKETYRFCPEFNDLQVPFEPVWNSTEPGALKIEACTWNVYSKKLMEALSELPAVKVFILVRELQEVFPSWVKQVEKAGFASEDIVNYEDLWDVTRDLHGFSGADDLLTDYRTTLCYGYWVRLWVKYLGVDRVMLIDNQELRDKSKAAELSAEIDRFLSGEFNLPEVVKEKNNYSTKRFPALNFIYRNRALKKIWFSLESMRLCQATLVSARYFIKEKLLTKKIAKKPIPLEFIKDDILFSQEMGYLDKAFLETRGK